MTGKIELTVNRATSSEIANHLSETDESYVPRLSARVNIADYARKISGNADRFEAWSNGTLIGLVAAYSNVATPGTAYITNVSVQPGYQGQGVASRVLDAYIRFALDRHVGRISLEVDRENHSAVDLYLAKGFAVVTERGRTIEMAWERVDDTKRSSPP